MKAFEAISGTDLKFLFSSEGAFSFAEHNWEMVFYVGNKKCTMTKENTQGGGYIKTCSAPNMGFIILPDGRVVFLLDSAFFGPGRLYAELTCHIPDVEFATLDKMRDEVHRYSIQTIKP